MQPQPSGITLVQRLQVIKDRDQVLSLVQLSQNYDVTQSVIEKVLNCGELLEQVQVKRAIRKHLS